MHEETLTKKAAELFPRLAQFKDFYLVGGTALALHIGHRISVDFDMFSQKELPTRLLTKVKQVYRGSDIAVTYRAPEQLNMIIDGVKHTFFSFDYPLVDALDYYRKVPVASIREIAAMKAFAIGKRLAYKDYVDWYFLLKDNHITLSAVIALTKKKFKKDFNDRLFLGQLVSLADVSTQKIDFVGETVQKKTMERFLKSEVQNYIKD